MKIKEELIKILSAYLPYELKVEIIDNPCKGEIKKLSGIMEFGLCFLGKGGRFGFHERSFENIKPILYSMDMLTKEIEHKGERFIPMVQLIKLIECDWTEFDERSFDFNTINYHLKKDRVFQIRYKTDYDDYKEIIMLNFHEKEYCLWHTDLIIPKNAFDKLLEWHFNVFGLEESEYIKKEAL